MKERRDNNDLSEFLVMPRRREENEERYGQKSHHKRACQTERNENEDTGRERDARNQFACYRVKFHLQSLFNALLDFELSDATWKKFQ